MTTRADFLDWKKNPVTREVFETIAERIYDLQVELGDTAGTNASLDASKVGAIRAYNDLLSIDFGDIPE